MKINNREISSIIIDNKEIKEAKINNKTVYSKESGGYTKYLTFTTKNSTATISLSNVQVCNLTMYTSTDAKTWTSWNGSAITVLANSSIYVRGENPNGFSTSESNFARFSFSNRFECSGNIMGLLGENVEEIPCNYCFYQLFYNDNYLLSAPELSATVLKSRCYQNMFYLCTRLTVAPNILPATTLADYCYYQMFYNCTSLTTAPELPATTLADHCCYGMFYNCTSLTTAPELSATNLAQYCYQNMFNTCSSLTTAPELPATTLADYCYSNMFYGCTALTTAPELPATILGFACYGNMFERCTSLTVAPSILPATTLANSCYGSMFNTCSSLTTAPELPATTLISWCYSNMFQNCSSLNYIKCLAINNINGSGPYSWLYGVASVGTFVKKSGTTWPTGTSGIPDGWTVIDI